MSNATNYALQRQTDPVAVWAEAGRDLVSGALAVTRLVVVVAGCFTLVVGGTLAVSGDARGRVIEQLIEIVTTLPATAIDVADRVAATPGSIFGAREAETTSVLPAPLDPHQRNVAQYLARRYRVADEAVRLIVASAYDTGRALGLDPLLILAVTAVESSMNPIAESSVGAQGLMQVMTRVHADKFEAHGGADLGALNPIANLKVGSMILKDLVRRGGSVERGLQLYVGAGNLQDDGGYAARVLAEHGRLATAAVGRVERALAAARAPAPAADTKPAKIEPDTVPPAQAPKAASSTAPSDVGANAT